MSRSQSSRGTSLFDDARKPSSIQLIHMLAAVRRIADERAAVRIDDQMEMRQYQLADDDRKGIAYFHHVHRAGPAENGETHRPIEVRLAITNAALGMPRAYPAQTEFFDNPCRATKERQFGIGARVGDDDAPGPLRRQ